MDVAQLRAHIEDLQDTLSKKVSAQRAYFEGQLSSLATDTPARLRQIFNVVCQRFEFISSALKA